MLVFSLSSQSSAAAAIAASDTIVVHLLDEHDLELAKRGATSGVDRFADTSAWARLATGEPVFPGVRAWVRCAIINRMDAGGSTVIAAHALQHHLARDVEPGEGGGALVYHNRSWHRLGDALGSHVTTQSTRASACTPCWARLGAVRDRRSGTSTRRPVLTS